MLLAIVVVGVAVLAFRGASSPVGAGGQPTAPSSAAVSAEATGGPTSSTSSVRALLRRDEPLVVAALGDSTGNETWEWVYEWARLLAETRPVTVLSWDERTEDGYVGPRVLSQSGDGAGGPVVIYSGHRSGARVEYVVDRLDRLLPERPDLVILNFGHNNSAEDVTDQLGEALAALRAKAGPDVPVVLTLQQPQQGDANAEVRGLVQAFAVEHGLVSVDVARAFEDSGDPQALLADAVHPNQAGATVWAEAVARTLGAP